MAIEHRIAAESPDAQAERLLDEIRVLRKARAYRREVETRVRAYEARFGLPSSEIHAAIDRGDLVETWEVCRWIIAYESLVGAEAGETR